ELDRRHRRAQGGRPGRGGAAESAARRRHRRRVPDRLRQGARPPGGPGRPLLRRRGYHPDRQRPWQRRRAGLRGRLRPRGRRDTNGDQRGQAMEVILGADDFGADQAERYGWINRALPDADLDAFVARLARRIASFPADAVRTAKRVLNELTLPGADAIRADARRFHQLVASDTAKARTATLFTQGLQTRGPPELDLGDRIGAL
ncbi:MAG: hypothetical protein JOZ49_13980, partial [Mycolicibacterium sp.]|nr:hypothetical protein [Mycolicibacterium sp.]